MGAAAARKTCCGRRRAALRAGEDRRVFVVYPCGPRRKGRRTFYDALQLRMSVSLRRRRYSKRRDRKPMVCAYDHVRCEECWGKQRKAGDRTYCSDCGHLVKVVRGAGGYTHHRGAAHAARICTALPAPRRPIAASSTRRPTGVTMMHTGWCKRMTKLCLRRVTGRAHLMRPSGRRAAAACVRAGNFGYVT